MPAIPPLPAPAAKPRTLSCATCGYDLTGLPSTNPCPECGTPIEVSMHGPLLRYALPEAIADAQRASRLLKVALVVGGGSICVGLLTVLLVVLAGLFLTTFVPHWNGARFVDPLANIVSAFCGLGVLFAIGAYTLGVFFLTTGALTGSNRPSRSPTIARYALFLFIPTAILAATLMEHVNPGPLRLFAHGVGVIATLSLVAHYTEMRTTMADLANRSADHPRIAPAGVGILIGVLILLGSELGRGWASGLVFLVVFFTFAALEPPIRALRNAVRPEILAYRRAHAQVSSS